MTDAPTPEAAALAARREEIERDLVHLATEDVVAEHAAAPFGRHSPTLGLVLSYFAQSPTRGKQALLADPEGGGFVVVTLSGDQHAPPELTEERYPTEAEAAQAVFVRRLRAIGAFADRSTR